MLVGLEPQLLRIAISVKISIVTAAKNAAGTIADTLCSVGVQDHADVEHVVIDGCSDDGTLDIIHKNSARVARVVSEADAGIYDAFNRGLKISTGDAIGFLNADDVYESGSVLGEVAREFERSDADIIFGDVLLVRPLELDRVVRYYSSHKFSPSRLARGFIPAHPAMFVRRTVYEHFGGFNPSYRIAGDFEWAARVFGIGAVNYRHLPRVLVRMREGGVSTRGIASTVRITREIRQACRDNGIKTSYLKLVSRFPEKVLEYYRRPGLAAC